MDELSTYTMAPPAPRQESHFSQRFEHAALLEDIERYLSGYYLVRDKKGDLVKERFGDPLLNTKGVRYIIMHLRLVLNPVNHLTYLSENGAFTSTQMVSEALDQVLIDKEKYEVKDIEELQLILRDIKVLCNSVFMGSVEGYANNMFTRIHQISESRIQTSPPPKKGWSLWGGNNQSSERGDLGGNSYGYQ